MTWQASEGMQWMDECLRFDTKMNWLSFIGQRLQGHFDHISFPFSITLHIKNALRHIFQICCLDSNLFSLGSQRKKSLKFIPLCHSCIHEHLKNALRSISKLRTLLNISWLDFFQLYHLCITYPTKHIFGNQKFTAVQRNVTATQ